MAKFHILEMREDKASFREVEGDAILIGGIIPCFLGYSYGGGFCGVYDADTGMRVSQYEDTHEEAIGWSEEWLSKHGPLQWRDSQMMALVKYGKPPETEGHDVDWEKVDEVLAAFNERMAK